MKNRTIHRLLISTSTFIFVLGLILLYNGYFALSSEMAAARAINSEKGLGVLDWSFIFLFMTYGAGLVGAWRGRRWAVRWLTFSVLGMLLCSIDESLTHPIEGLLDSVLNLLDGALLASLWLAPAADSQDS